jgi:predicted amidohydrolase
MAVLAAVTMDSSGKDKEANLLKMERFAREAAQQGADLVVFPELCLGGFPESPMFTYNPADALYQHQIAEQVPQGPSTQRLAALAAELNLYLVWGMAEQSQERFDVLYNAAVMVGPDGYVGKHRKVHQPLTERIMFYPGSAEFPVFHTRIGRIGLLICFDKCFPESTRILALKGAQVVLAPTAWPAMQKNDSDPDVRAANVFDYARALENMIFMVNAGSCGEYEMGNSRIIGPNPMQLIASTGYDEGMCVAEVDIEADIIKAHRVSMMGSDLLKDRKPALYSDLSVPNRWNPVSGDMGQDTETIF